MLTQMIPIGTKLEQITQEQLKERLSYDPLTGIWIWKLHLKGKTGEVAGSKRFDKSVGKYNIHIKLYKRVYAAHRLAFLYQCGYLPEHPVTHIDGNTLNNKWDNLKEVLPQKIFENKTELTKEYLETRLSYDAETGDLIWLTSRFKRYVGKVAGSVKYQIDGKPYLTIDINGMTYKSHHLVWILQTNSLPSHPIQHIDGNKLNNRWENLISSELPEIERRDCLTQEQLKQMLSYDPDTGKFTRLMARWSRDVGKIENSIRIGRCDKQYVTICLNKMQYLAHQLVFLYMTGEFPPDGLEVDHINQNSLDNRYDNLRLVTHEENMKNKLLYKRNTSGVSGVHFCNTHKKWVARLGGSKSRVSAGSYRNIEDAIAARRAIKESSDYHENHGREKGKN
jgi:hypothetical protein